MQTAPIASVTMIMGQSADHPIDVDSYYQPKVTGVKRKGDTITDHENAKNPKLDNVNYCADRTSPQEPHKTAPEKKLDCSRRTARKVGHWALKQVRKQMGKKHLKISNSAMIILMIVLMLRKEEERHEIVQCLLHTLPSALKRDTPRDRLEIQDVYASVVDFFGDELINPAKSSYGRQTLTCGWSKLTGHSDNALKKTKKRTNSLFGTW